MDSDLCPHCGSSVVVSNDVPPPHYAKRECIGVDHHNLGYVEGEWTLERALAWVMPFGKYRGKPMSQIDRHYLEWIVKEFEPDKSARKAAELVLTMPPKAKNAIQPLPGQTSFIE